jgi:hypothetical protein
MPAHLNFDQNGNMFIADKHNHCIRKITPDGTVTTFAGVATKPGYRDGEAGQAMFNQPCNIQIDKLGNLYVNDLYNHCIRLVYPDGYATTLAGQGRDRRLPGRAGGKCAFSSIRKGLLWTKTEIFLLRIQLTNVYAS